MPQQRPKLILKSDRPRSPFWDPPATDPLAVWPDEYDVHMCNGAWSALHNWNDQEGFCNNTVDSVGYELFALNYTFQALAHLIPSRYEGKKLFFESKEPKHVKAKRTHFFTALLYVRHYPKARRMKNAIGVSSATFTAIIRPTIYILADNINFIDWNLRLWHYNHTPHFDRLVTLSVDCFPIRICGSSNRWVRRLTRSGKYQEYVLKGELTVMVGSGLPVDYTGLHIGVRHDGRIWKENEKRKQSMHPHEYGIGDKAYVGCAELVCEVKKSKKKKVLSADEHEWNLTLQHYRGRNEHMVKEVVQGKEALNSKWRGSYALICAVAKLTVHMTTLQERMKGPHYDVYGPWPHF